MSTSDQSIDGGHLLSLWDPVTRGQQERWWVAPTVDPLVVMAEVVSRVPLGLERGDIAEGLRRRLPDLCGPGEAAKLRRCGDPLGGRRGRVVYLAGGRRVGGRKVCSSPSVCPVHSPPRSRDKTKLLDHLGWSHQQAGGQIVQFQIEVGHRWAPAAEALALVDEVARAVKRTTTQTRTLATGERKSYPARWAPRFRPFGVVGWVIVLHLVYSPANGWNAHAHGYCFTRSLGGSSGTSIGAFRSLMTEAVRTELSDRGVVASAEEAVELDRSFYVGDPDRDGLRAIVVQDLDAEGNPIWLYHSITSPGHPDSPLSPLYQRFQQLRRDRPRDWFETHPDARDDKEWVPVEGDGLEEMWDEPYDGQGPPDEDDDGGGLADLFPQPPDDPDAGSGGLAMEPPSDEEEQEERKGRLGVRVREWVTRVLPWFQPRNLAHQGPEHWVDSDDLWHFMVDGWEQEWVRTGHPPKSLEIIRDIGLLTELESPTAADLYREAIIATRGRQRFIITSGLSKLYPPPASLTDWVMPESDGFEVVVDNEVYAAAKGLLDRRGLQVDVMRRVEGLFADGQFRRAVDVLSAELGRRVVMSSLVGEGSDARRVHFPDSQLAVTAAGFNKTSNEGVRP